MMKTRLSKMTYYFSLIPFFISWKENKSHGTIGDIVDILSISCFSILIRLMNSFNWFDNLPVDSTSFKGLRKQAFFVLEMLISLPHVLIARHLTL